ncbi:DUF115 domain-containing protein [Planktomarina temperata]|nr:DUF115 domain-containing protein [Planktomarina temperata]
MTNLLPNKLYQYASVASWGISNNQLKQKLKTFKNKHSSKPALIIGNGPSINSQDMSKINLFVSYAANSYFLKSNQTNVHPNYLTVEDPLPAQDYAKEIKDYVHATKFAPYDLRPIFGDHSDINYLNFLRSYRPFAGPYFPWFSNDVSRIAFWGGTVVFLNIQLARYMGCNPIYFTGMDLNYKIPDDALIDGTIITSMSSDPNHFSSEYFGPGKRWHLPYTDVMQKCLQNACYKLKQQGISVFNLTNGGNFNSIPRANFDDIVIELEKNTVTLS